MSISKILSYAVLIVGLLAGFFLYDMNSDISNLLLENQASDPIELLVSSQKAAAVFDAVTPLYNLAIAVIIVLLGATVLSIFTGLVKNPSSLKNVLVGLVVFASIIGIAYGLAEGTETVTRDGDVISVGTSKWVGTGLITFYILSILAIASTFISGIKKTIIR